MIVNETGLLDDYGNDLDAYVWGTSEDGKRALVVVGETAYTASVDGVRLCGLRWECSANHLASFSDVYRPRYPID